MRLNELLTEGISFNKVSPNDNKMKELLDKASNDTFLSNISLSGNIIGFYDNDELVGFAIPRKEGKFYRTGPIFVLPEYRNQNIASKFIKYFFNDKEGVSYINSDNIASIRSFMSAGFKKTDKVIKYNNEELHQYKKLTK
jgi:GNAT superfamily N-acetyltransferase